MNEEELRAEVTRLTNENKTLTDNYNTVNDQIKVKDNEITSLNSNVNELKQKNYDLFIQVSKPIETVKTPQEKPTETTVSINDIALKLGGK